MIEDTKTLAILTQMRNIGRQLGDGTCEPKYASAALLALTGALQTEAACRETRVARLLYALLEDYLPARKLREVCADSAVSQFPIDEKAAAEDGILEEMLDWARRLLRGEWI